MDKETIELDNDALCKVLHFVTAKRGADGKWTIELLLDGALPIDELRSLVIEKRLVKFRATRMEGRKPNPQWERMRKGGGSSE